MLNLKQGLKTVVSMRKLYIIIALIAAIILSGIGIYYISNINPIQNTTKNDISDSESSSTNKTIDTSEINKPGKFSTIVESEIKVADPKITVEDPVASIVASFNSESIA